jgi:hypothetical protein
MVSSSQFGRSLGLQFSDNAITVLKRRYLVKDDDGNPAEAPEDTGRAKEPSKPSQRRLLS